MCSRCSHKKLNTEFYRDASKPDGLQVLPNALPHATRRLMKVIGPVSVRCLYLALADCLCLGSTPAVALMCGRHLCPNKLSCPQTYCKKCLCDKHKETRKRRRSQAEHELLTGAIAFTDGAQVAVSGAS